MGRGVVPEFSGRRKVSFRRIATESAVWENQEGENDVGRNHEVLDRIDKMDRMEMS
jgi:hypothetical protein